MPTKSIGEILELRISFESNDVLTYAGEVINELLLQIKIFSCLQEPELIEVCCINKTKELAQSKENTELRSIFQ